MKRTSRFFDVSTRQESKLWVFEDDPMPTMVKSHRTMKKVMYAVFLQKYGIDQIHQVGRTEDSNSKLADKNGMQRAETNNKVKSVVMISVLASPQWNLFRNSWEGPFGGLLTFYDSLLTLIVMPPMYPGGRRIISTAPDTNLTSRILE
ncbi:hypothetical protein TNCV_4106071 [Trichonephila clavipes]|nr:hypothetical protein TNCV_4106071 [Trichonephila clavipes]